MPNLREAIARIAGFFAGHRADDAYQGQRLALWIFGALLLLRTAISVGSMFNGYVAAKDADGIPIDSFGAAGVQTVLSLFAMLGFANLIINAIGVVALARYRSLVPLMFVLLLAYPLGRKLILLYLPVPRVGAPPGTVINLVILGLMIAGLALSLWRRAPSSPAEGFRRSLA